LHRFQVGYRADLQLRRVTVGAALEMPWPPFLRRERAQKPGTPGRPAAVSPELVDEIRAKRDAGHSLAQIARALNATGTPTAHGGMRWWPSTVRAVLDRITT